MQEHMGVNINGILDHQANRNLVETLEIFHLDSGTLVGVKPQQEKSANATRNVICMESEKKHQTVEA